MKIYRVSADEKVRKWNADWGIVVLAESEAQACKMAFKAIDLKCTLENLKVTRVWGLDIPEIIAHLETGA